MKKLNKKGFTIVELVIVIAVIAILAGVLIPTFATVVDKANKSKAMQEAKNEYEAYLAEYAATLKGDENLVIVSGKYEFKVVKGQFQSEAKAAGEYTDDLSKAYKKTTDTTINGNKTYYTYDTTSKKYTAFSGTSFADDTDYYEQYDVGSDNVYIYAAN